MLSTGHMTAVVHWWHDLLLQLSNLGKEQPVAVTGVVFEKGPAVTQGTHRYFIMVTLPGWVMSSQ